MPLNREEIVGKLWDGASTDDFGKALAVVPLPDLNAVKQKNACSLDLRLGRWFRTMKRTKVTDISVGDTRSEASISKQHYVRFNNFFVIHPGEFVIGNTLEWLRFPRNLSGYVTGKSSWGRRGLIIETAAGIHPGFTGCLTLEFANVGSAPIKLNPGMEICQIFFHHVSEGSEASTTQFVGYRKPGLGKVREDSILLALKDTYFGGTRSRNDG